MKVIRLTKSCWWPSKVRRTRWFDLFIKCSCVSSYHLWRKSRQEPQVLFYYLPNQNKVFLSYLILLWHLISIRPQIIFVCRHHYLVSHKKKAEIISNKLWSVGLGYGAWLQFQQFFSYIVVVSFIGGETGVPGENHQPAASHWQTWSHNVVSSTPRYEPDSNTQL